MQTDADLHKSSNTIVKLNATLHDVDAHTYEYKTVQLCVCIRHMAYDIHVYSVGVGVSFKTFHSSTFIVRQNVGKFPQIVLTITHKIGFWADCIHSLFLFFLFLLSFTHFSTSCFFSYVLHTPFCAEPFHNLLL